MTRVLAFLGTLISPRSSSVPVGLGLVGVGTAIISWAARRAGGQTGRIRKAGRQEGRRAGGGQAGGREGGQAGRSRAGGQAGRREGWQAEGPGRYTNVKTKTATTGPIIRMASVAGRYM